MFSRKAASHLPIIFTIAFAGICQATSIPPLTFHEAVSSSDQIVIGHVIGSSTSWGPQHTYIWTRYQIAVDQTIKGEPQKTVVVSEPGGTLEGQAMSIPGAVMYAPGERVALFLKIYPSGDKRTVGWGQGKLTFDKSGRILPGAFREVSGLDQAAVRARIQSERSQPAPTVGNSK